MDSKSYGFVSVITCLLVWLLPMSTTTLYIDAPHSSITMPVVSPGSCVNFCHDDARYFINFDYLILERERREPETVCVCERESERESARAHQRAQERFPSKGDSAHISAGARQRTRNDPRTHSSVPHLQCLNSVRR